MRDHRDGQDSTPVDITDLVREHTGKGLYRPLASRAMKRQSKIVRPPARGASMKALTNRNRRARPAWVAR